MVAPRKGHSRRADIPTDILSALNAGEVETATLAESLAIDFAALMRAVVPQAGEAAARRMDAAAGDGFSRRMALAGSLLAERLSPSDVTVLAAHRSDMVRGWAAYALCAFSGLTVADYADRIRPLADDPHFGVREWAWMSLRPHIAAALPAALAVLAPWTGERSANLRRFASEATRPRGVWCAHLSALRGDPAPGLAVLEPLRADSEKYVQDSVANWLNDATKDHPDWVRALCARWARESPVVATDRIRARALRSIGA